MVFWHIFACVFFCFCWWLLFIFQDILQQATTSLQPLFFLVGDWIFIFGSKLTRVWQVFLMKTEQVLLVLMTLLAKDEDIVISKYMSIVSVVFLALFFNNSISMAMSQFGVVDWGAIICGYIGLFLLGCSYAAIGVCCSVSTSQHTTAFWPPFPYVFFHLLLVMLYPKSIHRFYHWFNIFPLIIIFPIYLEVS